jgi:hypothetical protein
MMTMNKFAVTDVTYHRNGCCGRGFYSVRFSFKEDTFQPNMVAIMPADVIDDKDFANCFVMNLNDPTSNWRGDQFAADVRAAIRTDRANTLESLKSL